MVINRPEQVMGEHNRGLSVAQHRLKGDEINDGGALFQEAIQGTTLRKSLTSSTGAFPRLHVDSGQTGEGAHRRMGDNLRPRPGRGTPYFGPYFIADGLVIRSHLTGRTLGDVL